MKKFYVFGMAALLCASLFVLGCGDDGGGGGAKPLTLSDFKGTYGSGPGYSGGPFTVKDVSGGYDLTVTADSLIAKSDDGTEVATIPGLTAEGGGDNVYGSNGKWLYLVAEGEKIGVAFKANAGTVHIYLGKTAVASFENMSGVSTKGVEDGDITGYGSRL